MTAAERNQRFRQRKRQRDPVAYLRAAAEAQQKWRSEHPNYDAELKRKTRSTDEGRERLKEIYRRWYDRNLEQARLKSQNYYYANRLECIAASASRRANAPPVPPDEWLRIMESTDWCCAYCNAWADTLDHVIPLCRGGPHNRSNLVPACRRCNFRKHTSLPLNFIWRTASPHLERR